MVSRYLHGPSSNIRVCKADGAGYNPASFVFGGIVDAIIAEKPKRKPKAPPFDYSQKGCDVCPLKETWGTLRTPRMPMSGNKVDPDILVMGEAPGRNEDLEGKIFIGQSGRLLRQEIPSKFIERLAFQNTVRCRPPENRTPTAIETHCCSTYLEEDVERLSLKAILGTGNVPLHSFFPEAVITKIHGVRFPVKVGTRTLWYYPVFHPAYVMRDDGGKVRPIFENDMKRFFREVDRWDPAIIVPLSPDNVIVPATREEAETLISKMQRPVAVDLETTDLYPYKINAKILTASFSDGRLTISFPVDHPECFNPWGLPLLLDTIRKTPWIAHNVNFELSWFQFYAPGEVFRNYDDTMAMARLYFNRETLLSLEVLSTIFLGTNVKKVVNVSAKKITIYSLEQVLKYCGLDTMATALIFHMLKGKVDKAGYQRFLAAIGSVVGMELQGLPISLPTAKLLKEQWSAASAQQVEDVKAMQQVVAFTRDNDKEFNIASARQLATILDHYDGVELPRTAKGALSTAKAGLVEVAKTNTLARAVLDYREATKLESTYIDHVLEVPAIYPDGMLHPGYTVLFTATARLSSTNPNIQNFPRRRNGDIRNMIESPPGYVFLAFDYAQLEARVLAMASKDRVLCESIINGRDIHADWRDNLLNLFPDYIYRVMELHDLDDTADEKTLLKAARDRVKNQFVFASFYGSSASSCADLMGVPLGILEDLAVQFWDEFKAVKRWLKARRSEYQETGEMRTLTNRIRYQILYKFNEPVNTPIQGTAADIVADAMNDMTALSYKLKDPHLHPRVQVHDDLMFLVPDDDRLEYYIETIHPVLTKLRFDWQIVPLAVEAKIGTKWGELQEFAAFKGEYHK